jgi:hypothetical protein
MKKFLIAVLFVPALAHAESPWTKDCVRWWGGDIPQAERTKENCPGGRNHWDSTKPSATVAGPRIELSNNTGYVVNNNVTVNSTNNSSMGAQTVNLPNGSYIVTRSGSTTTVIQTSRSR